jgi:tetraacyldisaccharide 4'-kinase
MDYLRKYIEKIIGGRKKGFLAAVSRSILFLLSVLYSKLAKLRFVLYQNNFLKKKEAGVPVISIGNITTGGTGKTPFTSFLAAQLKDKATAAEAGDELFMLARNYDNLVFIRSANRYQGTKLAEEKGADLILLDDGFQHYQLKRNLDVVLIDAENPFSNNRVLPAGLMREPFTALKRADLFLINRSENIDFNRLKELKKSLTTLSPTNKGVFSAETKLESCITVAGQKKEELAFLKEKKVFAFSGIGSPDAFKKSIEAAGGELVSYIIIIRKKIF